MVFLLVLVDISHHFPTLVAVVHLLQNSFVLFQCLFLRIVLILKVVQAFPLLLYNLLGFFNLFYAFSLLHPLCVCCPMPDF